MPEFGRFGLSRQVETETISFSASNKVQHEFPKAGYITHLELLYEITYSVASGGALSAKEDALARMTSSLVVRDAGSRRFYEVSDGRQMFWDAYTMYGGRIRNDALTTTAGSTNTVYLYIPLHFGYNPLDKFDPTVVIPELRYGNIYLDLEWAAADEIGTNGTVSTSSKLHLIVNRIILKPGTTELDVWPQGVPTPRSVATSESISSVRTDLGKTYDILTEDIIKRTVFMFLNNSDNRTNANVTEFGVVLPNINMKPWKTKIQFALANLMAETGCVNPQTALSNPSTVTGVATLDWSEVSRDPLGMDVSVYDKGNIQLGFTTAVASGTIHMQHRYIVPGAGY